MLSRHDSEAIEAARRSLGRQLAALRQAAGYSQQEFAPLTGYGRSTLANVETGRQNVARNFWQRCAQALAAETLVTGYDQIEAMAETARRDAQQRIQADRDARVETWRQAGLDAGSKVPAAAVSDEHERLAYALAHPASADLVTVALLREQIRGIDLQYDRLPSTALIADTGQCLGQIGFLSAHARRPDVRHDLRSAESEAATLMGQLVWDASQRRDHDTALSYFGQAARAARSRADPAAESLALLRTGMVALYGRKDPRAGLVLCEQAAAMAGTVSRVLGGLAVLHAAEAHAMLGDRASCEQALGNADQQFAGVRQEDPAIDLYSPAQRGRLAGSCYLFLDDARRAAPILEDTARQYQDHSKSEAIVLGNLALARIRQGELDGAVASVHQAIDVIELTWGGGGLNVVFTATLELRRWQQSTPVRDLQDRVLTLMTAG